MIHNLILDMNSFSHHHQSVIRKLNPFGSSKIFSDVSCDVPEEKGPASLEEAGRCFEDGG